LLSRQVASSIAANVLHQYLRFVGPSLAVYVKTPGIESPIIEYTQLQSFLDTKRRSGAVLYVLWIADHLNLLALSYVSAELKSLSASFQFLADDSFGGLVVQNILHRIGAAVAPISATDKARRLQLLKELVSERPSLFVAVDGRGPYFTVGTGIVSLGVVLRADIIPCAIVSAPSLNVGNSAVSVAIPRRRSAILLNIGTSLAFRSFNPGFRPSDAAQQVEYALNELSISSRRLIAAISGWEPHG
jgi:hypothetical protein